MSSAPPPQSGWYPDPAGSGQRYWDGSSWGPPAPNPPQRRMSKAAWIILLPFLCCGGCGVFGLIGALSDDDSNESASSTTSTTTGARAPASPARPPTAAPLPPATSTISDDEINDSAFIATLDMFNVPYDTNAKAIEQAKALCLWYSANDTFFEMGAMEILKENPGYTPEDAGHFAGAATSVYCPEHSPEGE